ncbi:MAG: hypothetical protein RMK84_21010, partial [Oscillochloridaceae bacterium]|nr:hypothetical protein [Oscillochloridaceae bacterium]
DSFTALAAGPVTCDLTGPGSALAQVAPVANGCQVTLITPPAEVTPFEAVLSTPAGQTERVRFLAVASIGYQIYLPLVSSQARPESSSSAPTQRESRKALDGPITPASIQIIRWYFWEADGGIGALRHYRQIPAYSWPNTNGCWSGCGATAWAMLFGWVDERAAAGNPAW